MPLYLFYRPISSQPFSAGCHGNRNWWPIWKVAWWARVSCRRSRMYGIQCKVVQFCSVIPNSTAFFAGTCLICWGQRIARSNGKRNRSFTKNITTFAAVVEVLILIAMFFLFFFFEVLHFEAFVCTTRCQDTSTKRYLAYRELPKKNGYHFMKNCNASTHQPAYRKICLTLIMCIDMHFRSIFLSTFKNFQTHLHCQILFSFSTDKDRRTDSRIRRKNTAQPRRESNPRASLHLHWFCGALTLNNSTK